MANLFSVKDKVVIITGGAGIFGGAIGRIGFFGAGSRRGKTPGICGNRRNFGKIAPDTGIFLRYMV